jgi:hypothetical protein
LILDATQNPIHDYLVITGIRVSGACGLGPGAENKESDLLYIYSLYGSSWNVLGRNVNLPERRSVMKFYP